MDVKYCTQQIYRLGFVYMVMTLSGAVVKWCFPYGLIILLFDNTLALSLAAAHLQDTCSTDHPDLDFGVIMMFICAACVILVGLQSFYYYFNFMEALHSLLAACRTVF